MLSVLIGVLYIIYSKRQDYMKAVFHLQEAISPFFFVYEGGFFHMWWNGEG